MRRLSLFGLFLFALIFAGVGARSALAYEPQVHGALTQEAIFLYNYYFPGDKVGSKELEAMVAGAEDEDDFPRMLNHFYDPVNNVGLHYAGKSWLASKLWVNDPSAQSGFLYNKDAVFESISRIFGSEVAAATDFTWQRAVEDYVTGEEERAFEGLGHVLHLVEDLTVPAHVRNDPHPPLSSLDRADGSGRDFYELYTKDVSTKTISVFGLLKRNGKRPIVLSALEDYFDELAGYTNSHFYSQDTIGFDYYAKPNLKKGDIELRVGGLFEIGNDEDGEYLLAKAVGSGLVVKNFTFEDLIVQGEYLLENYWDKLSQKAVQYGAGVINLFFETVKARQLVQGGASQNLAQALSVFDTGPVEGAKEVVKTDDVEPAGESVGMNPEVKKEDLEAQVAVAQEMVNILSEQVGEAGSGGEVLGQSVEIVSEPEWRPSIQFGSLVSGGGGVSSAPGIRVEEESTDKGDGEGAEESEEDSSSTTKVGTQNDTKEYAGGESTEDGGTGESYAEASSTVEEVVDSGGQSEAEEDVDNKLPGRVTTLAVSNVQTTSLTLKWQATGDDDDVGQAVAYDIRYSLEEINEKNWEEAVVIENVSEPAEAYEAEEFLVEDLDDDTEYYFAIKVVDEEGNESELSNVASWRTLPSLEPILISEVFADMEGADTKEFIELYNPTDEEVKLGDWSIQYLSGSAEDFGSVKKKNFEETAVIGPRGFYLVGLKNYEGEMEPDMSWSVSLNNTGATIWLVGSQDSLENDYDFYIIDRVDYGSGEGGVFDAGVAAELPEKGQSLERRPKIGGVCGDFSGDGEWLGNGCDTGGGGDFVVRAGEPGPQNTFSFAEPRERPTRPVLSVEYRGEEQLVELSWTEATDWQDSSEDVLYILEDVSNAESPIELLVGSETEFSDKILEINKDYNFRVRAVDGEGWGSEMAMKSVEVPSYLSELRWYLDEASSTVESSVYKMQIGWQEYPFILPYIKSSGGEKIDGWHIVVFSYNNEPFAVSRMGQWFESHGWASAINMPNAFWVKYEDCGGSFAKVSGVIFPDSAERCSYLLGQPKRSALNSKYLGDSGLELTILDKTFAEGEPKLEDYVTVSYYAFDPKGNINSNMVLVAVDGRKYYLEEVEDELSEEVEE